jgi:hypothetical protein
MTIGYANSCRLNQIWYWVKGERVHKNDLGMLSQVYGTSHADTTFGVWGRMNLRAVSAG